MKNEKKPVPALTPEDYYINAQGLLVFTEKYHFFSKGVSASLWRLYRTDYFGVRYATFFF